MLVQASGECVCVSSRAALSELFAQADCAPGPVYSGYTVAHIRLNASPVKLNVTITPILRRSPIEVGDTVALAVNNSLSDNILTHVNFTSNSTTAGGAEKSAIGNAVIFHEYTAPGVYLISIRVRSISDPNETFERTLSISIVPLVDKHPVYAVGLQYARPTDKSIELVVSTAGGAPYSCSVNFGDSYTDSSFRSTARVNKFRIAYTYAATGMYNLSATCSNANSNVTQSLLVYLPSPSVSNITQMFVNKTGLNSESVIPLSLPCGKLGKNVKYEIYDVTEVGTGGSGLLVSDSVSSAEVTKIGLRFTSLRFVYNHFAVRVGGFVLAHYLLVAEEGVTVKPAVTVVNTDLKFNAPVFFDIEIKKIGEFIWNMLYNQSYTQVIIRCLKINTKNYSIFFI
jgi:hypothetical protein